MVRTDAGEQVRCQLNAELFCSVSQVTESHNPLRRLVHGIARRRQVLAFRLDGKIGEDAGLCHVPHRRHRRRHRRATAVIVTAVTHVVVCQVKGHGWRGYGEVGQGAVVLHPVVGDTVPHLCPVLHRATPTLVFLSRLPPIMHLTRTTNTS